MAVSDKEVKDVVIEGIDAITERKIQEITDLKVKCGKLTQQIKDNQNAINKLARLKDEVLNGEV